MTGGLERLARGLMRRLGRQARALLYRPERHYMRGPRTLRMGPDGGRKPDPAPSRRG